MPERSPFRGVLKRPFNEQVAAFRARLGDLVPTSRWDDISGAAHDRAFMIAGAMKADLLADLAGAVDSAIAEGTGLEAFRARFREIVSERGWHGWTGEGTRRGEAWRTRVIYRTNAATTYAAGRWAQLMEGGFPLLVYRHGGSREPRPQHLAWDGLTLPPDHEFWASHAPPNGWGCSCYVVGARSEAAAARLGGRPDVTLPPGWNRADPRTGAPAGIDRGWNHAPGASAVETILDLRGKLDHLPARPSIDLIQDWLRRPAFGDWLEQPSGSWPLARLSDADADAIGATTRIAVLSTDTALKQAIEHPELTPADYALAQRAVTRASHRVQDGERSMVFAFADDDGERGGIVTVVKATATGAGLFVTSLRRLSRDQAERDRELRRLLRRGNQER